MMQKRRGWLRKVKRVVELKTKRNQAMVFIDWLIISAILIAVWEALVRIIPGGWALVPVNIFCFLAAFAIGTFGYLPIFRRWMREPLAWLCAIALWFVIFVGIRSLL